MTQVYPSEESFVILPESELPTFGTRTLLHDAILALREKGPGWGARICVSEQRRKYMQTHAHKYAGNAGISITTTYQDGFLWVKYLRARPVALHDLSPAAKKTACDIRRSLGR